MTTLDGASTEDAEDADSAETAEHGPVDESVDVADGPVDEVVDDAVEAADGAVDESVDDADGPVDEVVGDAPEAVAGLVDVPDAEIVADAVAMDTAAEVDLLTDGPYAHPDDPGHATAALVVPAVAPSRPSRRQHRADLKASARRVRRVVRHVDPWSVFKVASVFIACVWGVIVLASLLIWRVAVSSGSIENTEDFIVDLGFEDFNFDPEQMFRSLLSAGAVMAIAMVFFMVLLTVLFNLICDLTGGLRVTMIEQDLADGPEGS